MLNRYVKKGVKKLANLQLAIGLLALISLIIGIGTIIEQDQPLTFYKENYPLTNPLFGVLTWKIILFFNFNQVYTSWWFLVILLLFGCSLLACTFTTQLPSLKNFKLWKFYTQRTQFQGLGTLQNLNLGYFNALSYQCNMKKYHFFRQQKKRICLFRFTWSGSTHCCTYEYYYSFNWFNNWLLWRIYSATISPARRSYAYSKFNHLW